MTKLPSVNTLELNLDQGWLQIRFNRPEARNAMNDALIADVIAVLDAVRDDRSVRGISFRGNGGVFCAGGDLKSFNAMHDAGDSARDLAVELSVNAGNFFRHIATMPQVTVALVEGAAMAGGFGVACATDLCFGTQDARMCMTETMIGLSPAQIAPYVLRRIGLSAGRRMMLTGQMINGEMAKQIGMFHEVAETGEALTALEDELKAQVLKCAPNAVAGTKDMIEACGRLEDDALIQHAADIFADCIVGEEGKEGVLSFVEKRKPNWVT